MERKEDSPRFRTRIGVSTQGVAAVDQITAYNEAPRIIADI